jgi:hypothetical protein
VGLGPYHLESTLLLPILSVVAEAAAAVEIMLELEPQAEAQVEELLHYLSIANYLYFLAKLLQLLLVLLEQAAEETLLELTEELLLLLTAFGL